MRYQRSLELFPKAYDIIPGGSQTNSKRPQAFAYGAYPIYAERAYGCRIEDIDGNTYIDLVGAFGPIILGYDYPAVEQAIIAQLRKGIITGLLYPVEYEVAKLLVDMIPSAEMVRFFKGGGEATSAAARIVRAYTGKEVLLNCGYRGWPDVWTATRNDGGIPKALEKTTISFPFDDLPALEQLLDQYEGQVAAVFIDVLYGEMQPGYLQAVQDLAHRHGALFCMDEVVTGFRAALGGAQEYFGVTPDVTVFAKAIANGMPLSAVVGRRDVMKVAEKLIMTITYGGEALSLAAAVATLNELRDKQVPDYLWRMGHLLADGLNEAAEETGIPFVCHGMAPFSAMRFDDVDSDQNRLVWTYFLQEMAARGVLMRRGGCNMLSYSHTEEDIATVVAAAGHVFSELAPMWKTDELAKHVHKDDVFTDVFTSARSAIVAEQSKKERA